MKHLKRWVTWMLVLATLLSSAAISASAEPVPEFPQSIAEEFADPSAEYRAGFRYELPGGQVDQAQVRAEIKAIKDAGFAVVEITASGVTDYAQYGLDSEAWRNTLKTIYGTCNELGLQADIHLSFNNGANLYVPGLEVTDQGVTKELVEAHTDVTGGTKLESGAALPVPGSANVSRKLEKLLAAKVVERKNQRQIEPNVTGFGGISPANTNVAYLDETSITDVTASASYNAETNTAVLAEEMTVGAEGEDWVLVALYKQGRAGTSSIASVPARKMDYFSQAGTDAFTRYYNTYVFDDELRGMMRKNGGDLFSDSYGADSNWTDDFLTIFREYKGYDIGKYLPVLFSDYFEIAGSGVKIRNDHKDVLTDLYCKYHLEGLTEFANSLGMHYRDQVAYSAPVDMMKAAMYVDVPETESLYFRDEIDNYVAMSAPANLTRKEMVSTEVGALSGFAPNSKGGYSQTWEEMLLQINRSLAGGVNQMLLHTYPYQSGPTSSWPGYTAFGPSFSENWGTRLPAWQNAKDVADYTARAQYVMRMGVSQRDVVFYKHNYDWVRTDASKGDTFVDIYTLTRDGYTYDFMNPAMMEHENAYAENGVIDPEGGAYKAFIIDSEQYPLQEYWARPAADMMPVETARKVQEYADAGVPILVVGETPSRTEGFAESDDEVIRIFAELAEAGQITFVDGEEGIADALRALDIRPNADNNTECGVTSYLRSEDSVNYYFLYNQGTFEFSNGDCYNGYDGEAPCDQTISLRGEGRPYLLNLWNGEVTPIADYTRDGEYVNVPVELAVNEACIIAVGGSDSGFHAVTADGDVFYDQAGNLMLRAQQPGSCRVTLANGARKTVEIPAVAAPVTPDAWTLSVESWTPANPFGTKGPEGAETAKTKLPDIQLTELKPWSEIPQLGEAISGIGTYTTEFTLDGPADGAVLTLGQTFDAVRVSVNGQPVSGVNQSARSVDLGALVHTGKNTLEIQSASTLRNAVRKVDPTYASKTVQKYGLLGPVEITPYVTALVSAPKQPVTVSLTGTETAVPDSGDFTYTVHVDDAQQLATATVTISHSAGLKTLRAEGLNGWFVISASEQDGVLTVVAGCQAGLTGSGDILKLTAANPGTVGTVAVTLEQAVLSAYEQETEQFLEVRYGATAVETVVDYSLYDVNRDGTVNQLDITRAQRAYGASAGERNWNALADVNGDGTVDIADLILILNNYSK